MCFNVNQYLGFIEMNKWICNQNIIELIDGFKSIREFAYGLLIKQFVFSHKYLINIIIIIMQMIKIK